jgi:hypothetical protein
LRKKSADISHAANNGYTGFTLVCVYNRKDIFEFTDNLNRVCIYVVISQQKRCCASECQLIDWKKHEIIFKKKK